MKVKEEGVSVSGCPSIEILINGGCQNQLPIRLSMKFNYIKGAWYVLRFSHFPIKMQFPTDNQYYIHYTLSLIS